MKLTQRELWAEARRLVVQESCTYADAAKETGLPLSTLQKRAGREGWQDQREASFGYAQTVRRLKSLALRKALGAIESADTPEDLAKATQLLFAWQKTEQAYPEHRYTEPEADPELRRRLVVEIIEGLVTYLTTESRTALTALRPHIAGFAAAMEKRHVA